MIIIIIIEKRTKKMRLVELRGAGLRASGCEVGARGELPG